MDEFGVLVESIGFKAHGKSAPMAKSRPKPKSNYSTNGFPQNIGINHGDFSTFTVDGLDGIFKSNVNIDRTQEKINHVDDNDIFGGPFSQSSQYGGVDLDSVFSSSNSRNNNGNSNSSNGYDDLFGPMPKQRDSVDDLFGVKSSVSRGKQEENGLADDDLIPGFGGTSPSNARPRSETNISLNSKSPLSKSSSSVDDDPFSVFESSLSQADRSKRDAAKSSARSSIDELEDFAMGKVRNDSSTTDGKESAGPTMKIKIPFEKNRGNPSVKERAKQGTAGHRQKEKYGYRGNVAEKKVFQSDNVLDDIFGGGVQQNHSAKPSAEDPLFDSLFIDKRGSQVHQTTSRSSSSRGKTSSGTTNADGFSFLFGETASSGEEFQEIDGESEERRKARYNQHMRTQARVAKALAEKNQRDFQVQQEQEERHRLAETLDNDIKRWAAGKEGNLRALLSSLQQVLWPECGWEQVSLTDLITSGAVKKVYYKANLCVHPDKVQQRGASVQQKYIAEKVFDLLKEAWNKFNAEELR